MQYFTDSRIGEVLPWHRPSPMIAKIAAAPAEPTDRTSDEDADRAVRVVPENSQDSILAGCLIGACRFESCSAFVTYNHDAARHLERALSSAAIHS